MAAIVFAVAVLLLPAGAMAASPKVQLETSIEEILDVLRDPALKPAGQTQVRREKLRTIAKQRFDYRRMSQLSLGKHWKERNEAEKDQFVTLFSQLLEDTYMSRVESYTDETVVFLKERIKKNRAQVDTKILTQSVEIPIDYRMYQATGGQWMVYDIVIEGVSLVSNYRSQFGQILERQSFDDLVKKLKEKKD